MSEKGIFIKDIKADMPVEGIFCIASKNLLETKNGAPYLALTVMDRTGQMEARVWNNAVETDRKLKAGEFAKLTADAKTFRNEVQLNITSAVPVDPGSVTPRDFIPVAPIDLEQCQKQLDGFIKKVKRNPLGPFLKALFRKGSSTRSSFIQAPAAKKMHQAYIGGLLEHSVAVASLADKTAGLYPYLDREMLIAGALVHDIGKIEEFQFHAPPIDYTDRGRLLGHSALGIEIIDQCALETGLDNNHPDIMALKHMVLSHHGQREFGASVLPMTPEALILHLIDDIDAKMNFLQGLAGEIQERGPSWSPYQRLFERFFYLRNLENWEQEPGAEAAEIENVPKQPGIFSGEF